MSQLWIMGCGDIGRRVASLYQKQGRSVIGWVRSEESLRLGEAQGISMRRGDLDVGEGIAASFAQQFVGADVFWFMPPRSERKIPSVSPELRLQSETSEIKGWNEGDLRLDTRLRTFLSTVQNAPRRIVLISTTGVYGDCAGRWIDETAPLKPKAARAVRRVDAENALRAWGERYQREWVVLRVPGIYAQDRLPLARLRRGEPVLQAAEAPWTNRIHADDLALICQVALARAASGSTYNVTDGQPSTMTDYFNQVADFSGLPRPPQVALAEAQGRMSAGMLSYLAESRRISNTKLLAELGVQLRYPSLRHGLLVT